MSADFVVVVVNYQYSKFVEREDRKQVALLPECLDKVGVEDNSIGVVYAFVDELDPSTLGFNSVTPASTGRPCYHPVLMFKIYVHGYLNLVRSSRRLERECQRNLELMWLTGHPAPDFKTITSSAKSEGRFEKEVFIFDSAMGKYTCPARSRLIWRFESGEKGIVQSRYWSSDCPRCPIKSKCTPSNYRRVTRNKQA